jgi:hypothetical protein
MTKNGIKSASSIILSICEKQCFIFITFVVTFCSPNHPPVSFQREGNEKFLITFMLFMLSSLKCGNDFDEFVSNQ